MSTRGGKRKGAGAYEGQVRPKFNMYWSEDEISNFMEDLKKRAKKSDKIAVFVAEHLFGKAMQPIGNPDGSPLTISFDPVFKQ